MAGFNCSKIRMLFVQERAVRDVTVAGDAQGKQQLAETEFLEVSLTERYRNTLTVCVLLTSELFDRRI